MLAFPCSVISSYSFQTGKELLTRMVVFITSITRTEVQRGYDQAPVRIVCKE